MRHHVYRPLTCAPPVVRVEDDPDHPDRVIVTDTAHNRANMTISSFHATCTLAPGAEVHSVRVLGG